VTKYIAINLVTRKAAAKQELLFNKQVAGYVGPQGERTTKYDLKLQLKLDKGVRQLRWLGVSLALDHFVNLLFRKLQNYFLTGNLICQVRGHVMPRVQAW